MILSKQYLSIQAAIELQRSLPGIIKEKGLVARYVHQKAGLSSNVFYRKIKNQAFTASELKRIIQVINNE